MSRCPTHPGPPASGPPGAASAAWTLGALLRQYGSALSTGAPQPWAHQKVLTALQTCRTAALGGHVERCSICGFERIAYNSCRNRHCPQCQAVASAAWVAARQADLLPVPYFHVVFTLPHQLNPLLLRNKRILYHLLFTAVAATLQAFGQQNLGGQLGWIAVLHTWDQTLHYHVHLHCLIPGGVLTPDQARWIPIRRHYFLPVKALSQVFRGTFLSGLQQLRQAEQVVWPAAEPGTQIPQQLWQTNWVVYAKPTFARPGAVLEYLGHYTHRVALTNHRLVTVTDDQVTFRYRDRRHGNAVRTMTLPALTLLRRFLLHVVPAGFHRIRQYGWLANRGKQARLSRIRTLLGVQEVPSPVEALTGADRIRVLTGLEVRWCPICQQKTLQIVAQVPPQPWLAGLPP